MDQITDGDLTFTVFVGSSGFVRNQMLLLQLQDPRAWSRVGPDSGGQYFEPSLARTASHHQEWINACKGAGQPSSDFAYGARLTEICLLGNLSVRTGKAFEWDGDKPLGEHAEEIAPLLKRDYRAW